LICTINIELSPIMNSFEQINVEQIETQCLNMVRNNFERLHESLDNRIKSLDSKLSNNKINYSSRYKS
jgi:hypothetical protein